MKPLSPIIFYCAFDELATCTIVFDRNEYAKNPGTICLAFQWTGDKSTVAFADYLCWMHSVFGEFAIFLNMPFSEVIAYWQPPFKWEFWEYLPNGKRLLLDRGEGQLNIGSVTPQAN